ncbi:MAG: 6-phosphogluconolactonase [Pseudomonadota bacterium]
MVNVRAFETPDLLVSHALKLLRETLPTPGNLMLSGGSTPYIIYNQLATVPCPVHPDRRLFLSDERMVPADSTDNNAGQLMPMLRALECEDHFIRVDTRLPAAEAALRFARDLEPLKSIDLGFLGMGSDGHTAGFFTPEQARIKSGALTLHTDRPDGMQGVSVTPAIFQRVEKIILLVTGESKRAIIDTLLNKPAASAAKIISEGNRAKPGSTIPAGIALASHPDVELWTDIYLP